MQPVQADHEASINFLEQLRPGGPWILSAIQPDGPIETITARNGNAVRDFVCAHDGKRNLYFSVNPARKVMNKKAAKADIAAIEYLLADLDPKDDERPEDAKARYLAALESFEPKPTAIIDSGNGVQLLWRLIPAIDLGPALSAGMAAVIGDIETRSKAMMEALGSIAGTQNIDRILRLPGTTNLPNKKKIKAGRVVCPTKLIKFNGAAHPLDAFPKAATDAEPKTEEDKAPAVNINMLDALPISDRVKNLIRGIDDPQHPYGSRSERVMAVLIAMAGAGCTDQQMTAVMRDASLPIGQHVRDQQSDSDRYLARQIARARKAAADPDVAKLNETYAFVLVGDKTAVMKESTDGFKLLTVSAFEQWHANRFVQRGKKRLPLAKHWLTHPQRRQYEGLTFAPGRDLPNNYNLWRGFAVKCQAGDCAKFLAHIKDNVCRSDEYLFKWVIGWFAHIVQHPDKKMGTSLVLRGKQGTGKTKVGEVIGSLLGQHYALVSDPRYVTGRFNSHLVSCLLLHCDESFWAGDHAAEGKLKDLITGDYQFIEFKGKEPVRVRNYVRLFVTGNPDWLVPAGFEERRFATLEMGEAQMQNKPYFAAIDTEMDNGGREALLDFLLHFDLTGIDLRTIPKTAALLDQKIASLTPEKGWWLDVLMRGQLPWGCDELCRCPVPRLIDGYLKHASRHGARRRAIETQIGMFLNKHVSGLLKSEGNYARWDLTSKVMIDTEGSIYTFPALTECREAFAKMMQQDIAWHVQNEWAQEPQPDGGADAPF
jgi:hypothetical protein